MWDMHIFNKITLIFVEIIFKKMEENFQPFWSRYALDYSI